MILVCRLNVGYEKEDENCLKRIGLIIKCNRKFLNCEDRIIVFITIFQQEIISEKRKERKTGLKPATLSLEG